MRSFHQGSYDAVVEATEWKAVEGAKGDDVQVITCTADHPFPDTIDITSFRDRNLGAVS
jgi:hypothetical protein